SLSNSHNTDNVYHIILTPSHSNLLFYMYCSANTQNLPSFPTRRSSDLHQLPVRRVAPSPLRGLLAVLDLRRHAVDRAPREGREELRKAHAWTAVMSRVGMPSSA